MRWKVVGDWIRPLVAVRFVSLIMIALTVASLSVHAASLPSSDRVAPEAGKTSSVAQSLLGAALLALDPSGACTLNLGGNASLVVTGGSIQVNSSSSSAVCSNGSGGTVQITAPVLNIVGSTGVTATNAPIHTGVAPVADPLAALPAPPNGPTQVSPPLNNNVIINPGYYPNGLKRTGGTLTLSPGVYIIDSATSGISVSGGASLIGHQVMIYMKSGATNFSGGGTFILDPPASGTYKDVTMFQARNNPAQSSLRGGNSLSSILGTLYFPNNLVDLQGNSPTLGNQIIAWQVSISGSSTVYIPYTGAFPFPPCPADIASSRGQVGHNSIVDIDDLLQVITNWDATGSPGFIPADVVRDGVVNIDDLVAVITAWGPCP